MIVCARLKELFPAVSRSYVGFCFGSTLPVSPVGIVSSCVNSIFMIRSSVTPPSSRPSGHHSHFGKEVFGLAVSSPYWTPDFSWVIAYTLPSLDDTNNLLSFHRLSERLFFPLCCGLGRFLAGSHTSFSPSLLPETPQMIDLRDGVHRVPDRPPLTPSPVQPASSTLRRLQTEEFLIFLAFWFWRSAPCLLIAWASTAHRVALCAVS